MAHDFIEQNYPYAITNTSTFLSNNRIHYSKSAQLVITNGRNPNTI